MRTRCVRRAASRAGLITLTKSLTVGRRVGLGFVFLWFAVGGAAHFLATSAEERIVPPYLPHARALVLVSGICELAGALGILWRPTRRAAAWGLFLLTIAVTPANIYMLQRHDLFAVPVWILVVRLPVQLALLALILWVSGAGRDHPSRARE
jgi:uncharacterized membrane protein